MILVITGIGSLIHIYSTAYMHDESDSEYARYFSYLNLFAAFMLVLVLGSNFPVMFVGWEGVGLCSYLLIGFWFTKKSAADAGKKAFIVNRIGDFGFILGMLLLFVAVRHARLPAGRARQVARCAPETRDRAIVTIATLLLFLGATGKSAQIPLYVWLPGRDGRPDAGLGADPRGDDGDGGRLHDRPQRGAVRARADDAGGRRRRSASRPR